jgi:flagellar biosynthesis regulator FlbT
VDLFSRHHLKTRKVDRHDVEKVCNACHKTIHALFTNRQLAKELNTVEALLANPEFAKALTFIRKQSPTARTRVALSRQRRRSR